MRGIQNSNTQLVPISVWMVISVSPADSECKVIPMDIWGKFVMITGENRKMSSTHGSNFSAVNSFDPCQSASLCLELFNLKET